MLDFIRRLRISCPCFILFSALLLLAFLGVNYYYSSQVYVVYLNNQEIGYVDCENDLQLFIEDLTERCGNLYDLELKLAEEITMVSDFRPGIKTKPEEVKTIIREEVSFLADAYLVEVNGQPFIPLSSTEELDKMVDSFEREYLSVRDFYSEKVLEVKIMTDISLQKCTVPPDFVFSADEAAALLLNTAEETPLLIAEVGLGSSSRSSLNSRSVSDRNMSLPGDNEHSEFEAYVELLDQIQEPVEVDVRTVEEITKTEIIPFDVEYIYDEEMPVTEQKVTTEGQDGERRLVYHLVRENGEEVDKIIVEEEVILEPITQVEVIGSEEVPKIKGRQFVWPVQGQGIIYNGFSSWHTAIDIHIAHGTNVLAADAGVVTYSGYGGTQGNYLILYHGDYWTLYLHNSEHTVSKGDRVSRGQVIAKVGATGRAFGPHLHFEVRVDDGTGKWHSYYQHRAVNPMQFF